MSQAVFSSVCLMSSFPLTKEWLFLFTCLFLSERTMQGRRRNVRCKEREEIKERERMEGKEEWNQRKDEEMKRLDKEEEQYKRKRYGKGTKEENKRSRE